MAITLLIIVFLSFNLAFLHRQTEDGMSIAVFSNAETRRLHQVQREFMFQTLIFVFILGVAGLIFSKLEGLSYVDGVYWAVVTTLLIGFGDVTPTTTLMKILAFPLIIISVVLLALIVTSIIHILADRARRRKLELKQRLKRKLSERKRVFAFRRYGLTPWKKKEDDELKLKRSLTLQEELEKLRKDDKSREMRANLKSVAIGFGAFLAFWFIGALIFFLVEVIPP
jgi:potassium channel subfamily K, other eukaryote